LIAEKEPAPFAGTGRFRVVRPLGSGAFGAVYEVEDRERGGHLALKVLARGDVDAVARFKREFRALAGLSHPNLLALHELV